MEERRSLWEAIDRAFPGWGKTHQGRFGGRACFWVRPREPI